MAEEKRGLTRTEQFAIKSPTGFFTCRDQRHAEGMMHSTSPVVGLPMEARKIVKREVFTSEWEEVETDGR